MNLNGYGTILMHQKILKNHKEIAVKQSFHIMLWFTAIFTYFEILLNSATVIAVAIATLRLSAVSRSGG